MFKNNIFSNPLGWAEFAVGSRRRYILSICGVFFQVLLLVFLGVALTTWEVGLGLSLPIFVLIAPWPLGLLRAMRALVLERRAAQDAGFRSGALPSRRNDKPDSVGNPGLFKNNIFNNPIGWGEQYTGSGVRYALAIGFVLFQALGVAFLLLIWTPSLRGGLLLSIPIILIISGMHLCYLRALRVLVLERRAARQEESQASTSLSTS